MTTLLLLVHHGVIAIIFVCVIDFVRHCIIVIISDIVQHQHSHFERRHVLFSQLSIDAQALPKVLQLRILFFQFLASKNNPERVLLDASKGIVVGKE
jgi:hypothetical protein